MRLLLKEKEHLWSVNGKDGEVKGNRGDMMVECNMCVYRHSCGKSVHECRDNHGGELDYKKLYEEKLHAGEEGNNEKLCNSKD